MEWSSWRWYYDGRGGLAKKAGQRITESWESHKNQGPNNEHDQKTVLNRNGPTFTGRPYARKETGLKLSNVTKHPNPLSGALDPSKVSLS